MTEIDLLEPRSEALDRVADHHDAAVGRLSEMPVIERRKRNLRPVSVALSAIVVAIGISLPLALTSGTVAARTLKLASYSFRLPRGFAEQSTSQAQCWTDLGGVATGASAGLALSSEAAASADGGCIVMEVSTPYDPTLSDPDPVAFLSGLQVTTVNGYQSYIGVEEAPPSVSASDGQVGVIQSGVGQYAVSSGQNPGGQGSTSLEPSTELYVEVRLASGQQEDLAVGANGLSDSQLIAIVASGLSGSESSGN